MGQVVPFPTIPPTISVRPDPYGWTVSIHPAPENGPSALQFKERGVAIGWALGLQAERGWKFDWQGVPPADGAA